MGEAIQKIGIILCHPFEYNTYFHKRFQHVLTTLLRGEVLHVCGKSY